MQQAYLIAIGILDKTPSGIWSQQFPAGAWSIAQSTAAPGGLRLGSKSKSCFWLPNRHSTAEIQCIKAVRVRLRMFIDNKKEKILQEKGQKYSRCLAGRLIYPLQSKIKSVL